MANLFEDFGISDEKVKFADSSENDRPYAKSLWQSFHLQPHMESRLVSTDIKQRLRSSVTPMHSQRISNTRTRYTDEQLHELSQEEFHRKLAEFRKLDELERIERFAYIREANRALLERHRQIRIEKEKLAFKCSPWKNWSKLKKSKFTSPSETICDYQDIETLAEDMVLDIENFERNILKLDDDEDSVLGYNDTMGAY